MFHCTEYKLSALHVGISEENASDRVSGLGLGLETHLESRWSLGLEGLRSRLGLGGFQSRSRALRLETLHRLLFKIFCKNELLQKQFLIMIVQNLAVQGDQRLSFLCCYVICEMEKIIFPQGKCFSKWAESPP